MDKKFPDLGNFAFGFDVKDLAESVKFYEKLGFWLAWGNIEEGLCVMSNGDTRFSMFAKNTIKNEFDTNFLFTFRGGKVDENFEKLSNRTILKSTFS